MNDQSKKKQSMSSKSDKLCLTLKQCGPQFCEPGPAQGFFGHWL